MLIQQFTPPPTHPQIQGGCLNFPISFETQDCHHPPPLTLPTPTISVLKFKVAARISPLKLDIVNTFPSHAPSPLVLRLSSIFPLFSVQALVVM